VGTMNSLHVHFEGLRAWRGKITERTFLVLDFIMNCLHVSLQCGGGVSFVFTLWAIVPSRTSVVIKRVLAISLRKNWIALMRLHQFNSNWFLYFSFCRTSLTFILLAFLQAYSGLLASHAFSVRAACSLRECSSDAIWRTFSSHPSILR
jgi:hypothetical protein